MLCAVQPPCMCALAQCLQLLLRYVDGRRSGLLYYMGGYMRGWLADLAQAFRLRLTPFFGSLA
jgi:hypothetical protein